MTTVDVAVHPWSQQSTRWRQRDCSHMLLKPPHTAATARAASADIVPRVRAAGEPTVDAPPTSWLQSGKQPVLEQDQCVDQPRAAGLV
mmetsp:Transcript_68846/g.188991  ORF Transcript_68846/g.188991 Transcript_68846/m.188991 type:complete len:88 (+) Transcript_68846:131-394(+)